MCRWYVNSYYNNIVFIYYYLYNMRVYSNYIENRNIYIIVLTTWALGEWSSSCFSSKSRLPKAALHCKHPYWPATATVVGGEDGCDEGGRARHPPSKCSFNDPKSTDSRQNGQYCKCCCCCCCCCWWCRSW